MLIILRVSNGSYCSTTPDIFLSKRLENVNKDTANKAAANNFVCQWNGKNYGPHSSITHGHVGKEGYGFKELSGCGIVTRNSRHRRICSWDGYGYSIYSFPGNTSQGSYSVLSSCLNRL